jgi:hypothetical protein
MRILPALGLCILLTSSCGDGGGTSGPVPPVPGALAVELTSPGTDDGALLVEISGPATLAETAVQPGDAQLVIFSRAASGRTRVLVAGNITAGAIIRFNVPDVAKAASWSATVVEVSDRANAVRASTAGYSLRIAAAP